MTTFSGCAYELSSWLRSSAFTEAAGAFWAVGVAAGVAASWEQPAAKATASGRSTSGLRMDVNRYREPDPHGSAGPCPADTAAEPVGPHLSAHSNTRLPPAMGRRYHETVAVAPGHARRIRLLSPAMGRRYLGRRYLRVALRACNRNGSR